MNKDDEKNAPEEVPNVQSNFVQGDDDGSKSMLGRQRDQQHGEEEDIIEKTSPQPLEGASSEGNIKNGCALGSSDNDGGSPQSDEESSSLQPSGPSLEHDARDVSDPQIAAQPESESLAADPGDSAADDEGPRTPLRRSGPIFGASSSRVHWNDFSETKEDDDDDNVIDACLRSIESWIDDAHTSSTPSAPRSTTSNVLLSYLRSPTPSSSGDYDSGECLDDNNNNNNNGTSRSKSRHHHASLLPKSVCVTRTVDEALSKLSDIFCRASDPRRGAPSHQEKKNADRGRTTSSSSNNHRLRDQVVDGLSNIPSLVKTMLLIDVAEDRERILSYPIVRRILLNPATLLAAAAGPPPEEESSLVGRARHVVLRNNASTSSSSSQQPQQRGSHWLVEMLKSSHRKPRRMAVTYLEIVSDLSVKDYVGRHHVPTENEAEAFKNIRVALFETVADIADIVPSMRNLSEHDMERAAVTDVIQQALDRTLSRPFGTAIVFLDLLCNVLLLVSYRRYVIFIITAQDEKAAYLSSWWDDSKGNEVLGGFGLLALFYFIFRDTGQICAVTFISIRVLINNIDLWKAIDVASIWFLFSVIFFDLRNFPRGSHAYFTVAAVSVGFLWLRFLGFLKMVNGRLATFILAVIQIVRDILWFTIVLLIVIFGFGDMLYTMTVSAEDACRLPDESSDAPASAVEDLFGNPYCEGRSESYLGVYRLILGDFSIEEYETSTSTMVIFLLCTFFGIIMLLNILIAIVSESYEKSTLNSARLFGRARAAFVGDMIAFESLLQPLRREKHSTLSGRTCVRHLLRLYFLALVGFGGVVLGLLVRYIASKVSSDHAKAAAISAACVAVLPLYLILFAFTTYMFTGWGDGATCNKYIDSVRSNIILRIIVIKPIVFVTKLLLGSSGVGAAASSDDSANESSEWQGRLHYMNDEMQRNIEKTENRLHDAVCALRSHMEEVEARKLAEQKAEFQALEKRILTTMQDCLRNASTHP